MLDLNGDGVRTVSINQGTQFDLAASGQAQTVGWVAPQDGLLVRDLNMNGLIDDGRELFGSSTRLSSGSVAQDGYQALKDLDSNADNVLDAQDTAFASLQVWVDVNSDGVTEAGELKSLGDLQIKSLDLQAKASQRTDQGNLVGLVSGYQTQDGAKHEMADVWLQVSEEPLSTVSQLTQALAELSEQADAGTTQVKLDNSALLDGMASTGSTATTMAQALAQFDANGQSLYTNVSTLTGTPTLNATAQALLSEDDLNKTILGGTVR